MYLRDIVSKRISVNTSFIIKFKTFMRGKRKSAKIGLEWESVAVP